MRLYPDAAFEKRSFLHSVFTFWCVIFNDQQPTRSAAVPAASVAASLCDALRRRVQRDGYTEGFWDWQTICHPVFFGGGGPPPSRWNASGFSSVARHGVARFTGYEGQSLSAVPTQAVPALLVPWIWILDILFLTCATKHLDVGYSLLDIGYSPALSAAGAHSSPKRLRRVSTRRFFLAARRAIAYLACMSCFQLRNVIVYLP